MYTTKQHIQAVVEALSESVRIDQAIEELRMPDGVYKALQTSKLGESYRTSKLLHRCLVVYNLV